MVKLLRVLAFGIFLISVAAQDKWWETASFYQIYPRSFQDSDGNGIGDLKGVASRLPYLKEIGISATWLSPIFTSPMADFGYDIANFYDIDPLFGTMADFEALIAESKRVGVKIILDFVPNHSSDECEWFIKSENNDPEYADFYVWHPGKIVNGTRYPPNNWISVFRGPAWSWSEKRQAYYLHQFLSKQPDLNYRNRKVVEAMKDVLRFWLRKGASGFRIDAVPHIFEVEADMLGNYPDEPRNPSSNDPQDYEYLSHIYTVNRPETTDLIYEFRAVIDEIQAELGSEEPILMIEAYAPRDIVNSFYGNATVEGAQIPFNFELISNLQENSNALYYESLINEYLAGLPEGRAANWVIGNHDRSRVGSRLGTEKIDLINILLKVLPGVSVTYQGEEIGMTNVFISWNDTVDPQACQSNPEEFERLTRDPCRTPFQWNTQKFAGFTTAKSTWLPVASNYQKVNVQIERGIPLSHLNIYKHLQSIRQTEVMRHGSIDVRSLNENVLAIKRSLPGHKSYFAILNTNQYIESIDLQSSFVELAERLEFVVITDKSPRNRGDQIMSKKIPIMPNEAVVLVEV